MEKRVRFVLICLLTSAILVACGPSQAERDKDELTTPAGTFIVEEVQLSDRFPPDCDVSSPRCQQAAPGYQVLVVWLEAKGDVDPLAITKSSSKAYVIASDNSRTDGAGGGMLQQRYFLLFTPPSSAANFTLYWFDNPSIDLGK